MDPLISIIVPVYNMEDYLARCVDSILEQGYQNIEVILINDGSLDRSGKICDHYSSKDKRVRVIHKGNGGLADARNSGLAAARGEYITFIDSDDHVDPGYVRYLYRLLEDNGAAVSVCEFMYEDTAGNITTHKCSREFLLEFTGEEACINQFYRKDITNFAWGKMFRKELFAGIEFPKGMLYEDLGTLYKVFDRAEKIVWGNEPHYYYLQRKDSIMHSSFSDKKMDRIKISEQILEFTEGRSDELRKAAECRLFVSAVQVLREMPLKDPQYAPQYEKVAEIINRYKRSVMKDKDATRMTRLIARSFALFPSSFVKKLGVLYKKVYPN